MLFYAVFRYIFILYLSKEKKTFELYFQVYSSTVNNNTFLDFSRSNLAPSISGMRLFVYWQENSVSAPNAGKSSLKQDIISRYIRLYSFSATLESTVVFIPCYTVRQGQCIGQSLVIYKS